MGFSSFAPIAVTAICILGTLAFGCSKKSNADAITNGNDHVLYFASGDTDPMGPAAVGVARDVLVTRHPSGTVDCPVQWRAERGIKLQGFSPPAPYYACQDVPVDPLVAVSSACDDDACDITTEPSATLTGAIVLHVVAKRAGVATVHVSTKSSADGQAYDDSIGIEFATAKRIKLTSSTDSIRALRRPLLPGVVVVPPESEVVDADDRRLNVGAALAGPAIDGDLFDQYPNTSQLEAKNPGLTTMRWTLGTVLSRNIDLEVVSPSAAKSILVLPDSSVTPPASGAVEYDDELPPEPEPITSIAVSTSEYDFSTFPTLVLLRDGRTALAPVSSVAVAPAALAHALPSVLDTSAISFDVLNVVGDGTITIGAAGTSSSFPLHVSARSSR